MYSSLKKIFALKKYLMVSLWKYESIGTIKISQIEKLIITGVDKDWDWKFYADLNNILTNKV